MFEYGLGGTERKLDNASEAFADISPNKTLFIEKLTAEAPFALTWRVPETVDEVFQYFQPAIEVGFQTEEGTNVSENLRFNSVGDFGSKGIAAQSKYLTDLNNKKEQYLNVVKELKSNKALQTVVQSKENKEAFLSAILAMIKELEETGA